MKASSYLESKPRYEILDGLRGVAALGVVMFHMMECYPSEISRWVMPHGFMSVDFFFALSGLVLGYAYDDRWDRMSTWDFFKRRLTRLQPMAIMGVIIGICFFYYTGGPTFNAVDSAPWYKLLLEALLLIFMIPLPKSMDIRGWGELTSINGPIWTLIYEYVANIFYALFLRRTGKLVLGIIVAFCALMSADLCLQLNLWGNLVDPDFQYTINGGFICDPEHIYRAMVRLMFPFTMGLLLSRIGHFISVKRGFLIASLLIIAMVATPMLTDMGQLYEGIYELCCILLLFPVILSIGAGSKLHGERATRICTFVGQLSFPLYITHYPILYMHMSWAEKHMDAPVGTHVFVGICTFIMVVGVAWACLKLYDIPVRNWLKEHWLKK
ncbi:MAG: acyltransferase [Bacteroidales bacterium]|nr:acyltransferase [Bacteroidales bacterium]